ncbi:hypothetical protein [Azospirillum himalayense]|uniref:Uncharacterized protein n=1 Tax=Azospirillum himalayense TaxID=654847 RepID=A0ABW0G6C5_9PROT
MALSIEHDTDIGAPAVYHRIITANVYYADGCVDAVVHGYVSEDARRAGKAAITATTVRIPLSAEGSVDRATLYAAVKADPAFADAIDC